jgi:hypothetical protein
MGFVDLWEVQVTTKKQCRECGERKPRNKFGTTTRTSDGVRQPCKECRKLETERGKERKKVYDKRYRIDNEEKIKKDQAQRRIDNKEYYIELGKKYRKRPGYKEAQRGRARTYYVENQEAVKVKVAKYKEENYDEVLRRQRERAANETPEQREKRLDVERRRYDRTDKTTPEYKASKARRSRIRRMRLRNVEFDGHTLAELHTYWLSKGIDPKVCYYCDDPISIWESSVGDHVIPISRGGRDVVENLVPCCSHWSDNKNNCQNSKFTKLLSEWIPPKERVAA